jgi:hypothetical protein
MESDQAQHEGQGQEEDVREVSFSFFSGGAGGGAGGGRRGEGVNLRGECMVIFPPIVNEVLLFA